MRALLGLVVVAHATYGGTIQPPRPVLTDLQWEQIHAFANLVLEAAPATEQRVRTERALADVLARVARVEKPRGPKHRLTPWAPTLEAHVDTLADELVAIEHHLRGEHADGTSDDHRDAIASALNVIARLHLAAGANRGEPDELMLRLLVLGHVVLAGSALMVAVGLRLEEQVLWMKGAEGALSVAIAGLAVVFVVPIYRWISGADEGVEAGRRRVAESAHRRFWTRVAAATGRDEAEPADVARAFVRDLVSRGDDVLATCARMLGRPVE